MKRTAVIIALVAMFVTLLWSIGRLFALRFERGDVYPAYSTLRMDPMGAKALADSLALLPRVEVRRNYRPLLRLRPPHPVTLVYLDLDHRARWEDAELDEFERIIGTGSRAIFAFSAALTRAKPQQIGAATPAPGATPTPVPTPFPSSRSRVSLQPLEGIPFRDVAESWDFGFAIAEETQRKAMEGTAVPSVPGFDEEIPWHSALYFKVLRNEWKTLYTCNEQPVIIERKFDRGSIVLCSDSYFLSNEGLGKPPAKLLASMFHSPSPIIFDEEHLGVTESSNIANLARRMRLDGLVVALLAIAGLFIWKQSSSLLPRQAHASGEDDVSGRDANEGFIQLLHRSVPPASMLDTCVAAWTRARGRQIRPEERAHIEAIMRAHGARSQKDAAAAYRAIAEGLKRR